MTENLDRSPGGSGKSDDSKSVGSENIQQDHGLAPDDPLAELIRLVRQEDPFTKDQAADEPVVTTPPSAPVVQPPLNVAPAPVSPAPVSPVEEPVKTESRAVEAPLPPSKFIMDEPAPAPAVSKPAVTSAPVRTPSPLAAPVQRASVNQGSKKEASFVPPVLEVKPPVQRKPEPVVRPEPSPQVIAPKTPVVSAPAEPVSAPKPTVAVSDPARRDPVVDDELFYQDSTPENPVELEPMDLSAAIMAARETETIDDMDFREIPVEEVPDVRAPTEFQAIPPVAVTEPLEQFDSEPAHYTAPDLASLYQDPAFDEASPVGEPEFPASYPDEISSPTVGRTTRDDVFLQGPTQNDDLRPELEPDYQEAQEPTRRRGAVFAVGLLLGLAVVGGSLAFAFIGDTGSGSQGNPPPLLRADNTPAKVAPDNPSGQSIQHQNNLVYQENGSGGTPANEQLVSREEQIVGVPKIAPKDSERPGTQTATLPAALQPGSQPATSPAPVPLGTTPGTTAIRPTSPPVSNVAPTPRRVRTVVVRPDGTVVANPTSAAAPTAAPATASPTTVPLPPARPNQPQDSRAVQQLASAAPQPQAQVPAPAPTPVPAQPRPAVQPAAPNAPISLTPPSRAATQQTAAVAPQPTPAPVATTPAPATGSGQFVVQVAARRSEEQANAAFAQLRSQYGSQVGRYGPLVQRADLGDRGVYYRLRIGPMRSQSEALQVCENLKIAGLSDCLVRPR